MKRALLFFALGLFACSKTEPAPTPAASTTAPVVASTSAAPSASASASVTASAEPSASAAPSAEPSTSASASAVASASAKAGPKTFACGDPGQPKCPLQGWMKANIQPAMSGTDPAKVAELLRKIATLGPKSGYPNWAKIANDGAAAVDAAKTIDSAKPSCKSCHDQYKNKYKSEDRDRPI